MDTYVASGTAAVSAGSPGCTVEAAGGHAAAAVESGSVSALF